MTIHHFAPDRYHTTMGSHEPALRIKDGDTVITTTVDAAGQDQSGEQITERGNPQTGPFHIEGAEPGDALELHLDRLEPNRGFGYSGSVVAPRVVDPDYLFTLPRPEGATWLLDRERRSARLDEVTGKLSHLQIGMAPMLGCFGVAPAGGEAISTATSGPHGGNMDYRGFVAGVTVYFPVFVTGALLFLGDGHAVQGDGEIVGTGIETSMDVQVTVNVIKDKRMNWPRGGNQDYIFTVGNARPLDQAVQHATTEMLRWLQQDFDLNAREASTVLGQCVEYDLGNVFDPAYTMVCKLSKGVLRQLSKSS